MRSVKRVIVLVLLLTPFSVMAGTLHLGPHIHYAYLAFKLVAALLVLFMTVPGLVMFYGGMVQRKNVLSIFSQTIAMAAIVTVLWLLVGYSLVFGQDHFFQNFIGKFSIFGVDHVSFYPPTLEHLESMINMIYQMGFAIIAVAIIIGGFAERMKFSATLLFAPLWLLIVYCPVAHWMWGGGWLQQLGVMDFAGGTVVHINAGIAGLVAAIMLRERKYRHEQPNSLIVVTIGTGILWLGWFGFNGGSADNLVYSTLAIMNTQIAPAAAALGWMLVEWLCCGKPSARGLLFGLISGLVAITPAAGYCSPLIAALLGFVSAMICFWATQLKSVFGYDDALDVFGIHGVAGIIGSILTGVVAAKMFGGMGYQPGVTMLGQVGIQVMATVAVLIWSGVCTFAILWVINKLVGLRVSEQAEDEGLDMHEHGERVLSPQGKRI